jgi:hypothetical protein
MRQPEWTQCDHLVLVAGHAVYIAEDFNHIEADESWFLQSFQKGEPNYYIDHIRRGVEITADDQKALLVFSGGQTRFEAGPRSEAQSYWLIANHQKWWQRHTVADRTATEEYARDSFENLLFGVCRFFECVGSYPSRVTVVSWAFKESRFELHRKAIHFPSGGYVFEGVNNPIDIAGAEKGEQKAIAAFSSDPFGLGDDLRAKREARNPFNREPPYSKTCPGVAELFGRLQKVPWRNG